MKKLWKMIAVAAVWATALLSNKADAWIGIKNKGTWEVISFAEVLKSQSEATNDKVNSTLNWTVILDESLDKSNSESEVSWKKESDEVESEDVDEKNDDEEQWEIKVVLK